MLAKLQSELKNIQSDVLGIVDALMLVHEKHFSYLKGNQKDKKHFDVLKETIKTSSRTSRKVNSHIIRLIALYNLNSTNLTQGFIYAKANFALTQVLHLTKSVFKDSKVNFDMDISQDELLHIHKGTVGILQIVHEALSGIEEPERAHIMLGDLEKSIKVNRNAYKALERKILKIMKKNNKDLTNEFHALVYLRDLLEVDRACGLVIKDIADNAARL